MDCSNIKLIAMDLDGTLTQHKTKLEDFNKLALDSLSEKYRLVLTGAGACSRIYEQLNHYPVDIIGNYGMQFSVVSDGNLEITKDYRADVDRENVTRRINKLRQSLGFQSFIGDTVEFHASGMITFPILGTAAKLEDKLKYDPDRKKRRALYNEVNEMFDEYTVFVGGTSSFDIVPPPYNKLFALDEYAKEHGYSRDNIVYIGDDYGTGGNDEQVYNSDIKFICIDDYTKFPDTIKILLT